MADKLVLFEDEIEGNIVETNDYIFDKIGEAVPIRTDDFRFDPQSSPSRPLAVSEKHGLVFVAYSSGFFVARTRDVMASAADIKEKGRSDASASSIQQLSVADVPLAKLHILALSTDNSTLAATADADIHFFSVGSLLDKGLEPSYSCSLDESSSVKDMQWTKKSENIYVVLSNLGKLYHGTVGGPLKDKMDKVDAVEWSFKGKLIAVARKGTLKILSSSFVEMSCMLLSFDSRIGDPDTNYIVKVDTIKWVRHDSIILGCFQLNADGNEENYFVQVIQIKDGKFTNESCKPVVISFYDMFSNLIDDILRSGSGPYLLVSYLEECELAITANRKNADQHVVYLSWSLGEESNEAVVVDIVRDNLKPRIELQENGDDNLIMGLCVDKISVSQKVSVRIGMEQRELSPYCILICLTLDGKLIMYHVASLTTAITPSSSTITPLSVHSVAERLKALRKPRSPPAETVRARAFLSNLDQLDLEAEGSEKVIWDNINALRPHASPEEIQILSQLESIVDSLPHRRKDLAEMKAIARKHQGNSSQLKQSFESEHKQLEEHFEGTIMAAHLRNRKLEERKAAIEAKIERKKQFRDRELALADQRLSKLQKRQVEVNQHCAATQIAEGRLKVSLAELDFLKVELDVLGKLCNIFNSI